MFPEYRNLITQLKSSNHARFLHLFDKHNELDHQIENLIKINATDNEINILKKEKLAIKDEIHDILKTEAGKI